MITDIIPKLPMRDRKTTHNYYVNKLGFRYIAPLENKPWQQREFSLLDPDNNLLTFGQDNS
jgi:hypothetical protein